jgi:hypothetical protein
MHRYATTVDETCRFTICGKRRFVAQIDGIRLARITVCTAESAVIQTAVPLKLRV